jgi:hypothetical protein
MPCNVEVLCIGIHLQPAGEQFDTFTSDELTCIGRWICRFRHVPWP